MATQWDAWLRDLRAAGKGGERYPQLEIDRGRAWSKALRFAADYSADAFAANLALGPDGTTLVSPTVNVGAYTGGYTIVTLSLTAVQTANAALIPADGDIDGVVDLALDVLRTPSGGTQGRLIGCVIPVTGKV
jgi:hypothetical protein